MGHEIIVKRLEPQPVASIVIPGITRAAIGAALHGALPDVFSHLQAHGIEPAGPPFARVHGDADATFDVEIGLPVPAGTRVPETGAIEARTLPGGEAATILHEVDDDPFDALAEWKAANGRVSAGSCWESYLDQARAELVDPLAPQL